jgi:ribosomal protein S27E
MKRCKKANVIYKIVKVTRYEVQCPHCETYLSGYFDKETMRIKCLRCGNPIELVFGEDEKE